MIDPNDLMIGNYVVKDGIFYKVTLDTFRLLGEYKIVYKGDFSFSVKNDERIILEPIPIAKEWLLKLGFVQSISIKSLYHKGFINITLGNKIMYEINDQIISEINYIHEVQNLYYWHTKQKLTIQ